MIKFLIRVFVNALAIVLIAKYYPWIDVNANYGQLAIIGAILGVVNGIIR